MSVLRERGREEIKQEEGGGISGRSQQSDVTQWAEVELSLLRKDGQ